MDELKDLYDNGVERLPPGFENPITVVKVHTLLALVDSVEQCALQNIHQYDGEFGCTYCLSPGETVEVTKGHSRVYSGKPGKKRTAKQYEADAEATEEQGTIINRLLKEFPCYYFYQFLISLNHSL